MMSLAETLHQRLQALSPISLSLIDESEQHKGHAGAKEGGKHFAVTIISAQFEGLSLIQRHQSVYRLVQDLIPLPLHALKIKAEVPTS